MAHGLLLDMVERRANLVTNYNSTIFSIRDMNLWMKWDDNLGVNIPARASIIRSDMYDTICGSWHIPRWKIPLVVPPLRRLGSKKAEIDPSPAWIGDGEMCVLGNGLRISDYCMGIDRRYGTCLIFRPALLGDRARCVARVLVRGSTQTDRKISPYSSLLHILCKFIRCSQIWLEYNLTIICHKCFNYPFQNIKKLRTLLFNICFNK